MRKEDFFETLGELDDAFIKEADAPAKRKGYRGLYGLIAAGLVLAIAAIPFYQMLKPADTAYHSYVLAEDMVSSDTTAGSNGENADSGIADTGDTAGVTSDENGSDAMGAVTEESSETARTETDGNIVNLIKPKQQTETDADAPNTGDLPNPDADDPNTGDLPNPPADAAVQEEAAGVYQNLMARFVVDCGEGNYPDWYGGSYIDYDGTLVINMVSGEEYEKEFLLQIQEWAGSDNISFGDVPYSLNHLLSLQQEICALQELNALSSWGCGVDEERGQVRLSVPVADEALLAALAKLDPADDAILVLVGERAAAVDLQGVADYGEYWIDREYRKREVDWDALTEQEKEEIDPYYNAK